jgi:GT2 family glycosyltransferase
VRQARVSAVVATRDRQAAVVRTVVSILASDPPAHEVIVIDQSSTDETEAALRPLLGERALRYHRSGSIGLSRARNQGIRAATGEFVALTDDDCEVPRNWIEEAAAALESNERIALVFGNVLPAPFDAAVGFIPGYVRDEPFLADEVRKKVAIDGIGASMALRRTAWHALGGFDEMLGSGSVFPGGDEGDFAMRALGSGWCVLETPRFWIQHHGYRTRVEGEETVSRYARGTGAMMAKHLRCRTPGARTLLAAMAWRWSRGVVHQAATVGDGRHRLRRLRAFASGFAAGARAPLDRSMVLFVPDGRHAVGG